MSSLARIIEKTIQLVEVVSEESTDAIDLNGSDKYSIQVVAVVGDCIANLECSNNGSDWTELSDESIAEDASFLFEVADADYKYARITLENDDMVDVSADVKVLVIGDAE